MQEKNEITDNEEGFISRVRYCFSGLIYPFVLYQFKGIPSLLSSLYCLYKFFCVLILL